MAIFGLFLSILANKAKCFSASAHEVSSPPDFQRDFRLIGAILKELEFLEGDVSQ